MLASSVLHPARLGGHLRRRGAIDRLLALDTLYRQRRALARLDARSLHDIGLDARQVARELGSSDWSAPAWWS